MMGCSTPAMTTRAERTDLMELGPPEVLPSGFVKYDAFVARAGCLTYLDPPRVEYRPHEENVRAVAAMEGVPVTLIHPNEGQVTVANSRGTISGTVLQPRMDGERIRVKLLVTDASAIQAIKTGAARQLSLGYSADVEQVPGVSPSGERYDCVQRNLVVNHVAIVPEGRAGSGVSLRADGFDPDQPRDEAGKWSGEGARGIEKVRAFIASGRGSIPQGEVVHAWVQEHPTEALAANKELVSAGERLPHPEAFGKITAEHHGWKPIIAAAMKHRSFIAALGKHAGTPESQKTRLREMWKSAPHKDGLADDVSIAVPTAVKEQTMMIRIDGKDVEATEVVAGYVQGLVARADKLESELKALPERIRAEERVRSDAIAVATKVGSQTTGSLAEIQAAVATKVLGLELKADAAPEYVAGCYAAALKISERDSKPVQVHADSSVDPLEAARVKYLNSINSINGSK